MNWVDILKRDRRWNKHVYDIMSDGEPRVVGVIQDKLSIVMTDYGYKEHNRWKRTGRGIPSRNEISKYLKSEKIYEQIKGRKWVMVGV